jgi:hypothetical protein
MEKIINIKVNGVDEAADDFNNLSKSLGNVTKEIEGQETEIVNVKTRYKELIKEILTLEEGSDRFNKLTAEAGALKDQIGDVNARVKALASDTRQLDVAINIAQGIAGGFSVATGALSLFGVENENVQKAMLKVQSAMAILNGLQTIQNFLNKDSAASIAFANVQRTIANATESQSVIVKGAATAAQWLLNTAMSANPIGLVVVALGALIGVYTIFGDKIKEVLGFSKSEKEINEELIKVGIEREAQLKREADLREKVNKSIAEFNKTQRESLLIKKEIELFDKLNSKNILEQTLANIELLKTDKELQEENLKALETAKRSLPAGKEKAKVTKEIYKAQLDLLKTTKELNDLEATLNQNRAGTIEKIETIGVKTVESGAKQKKVIKEIKVEASDAGKVISDEADRILARREEIFNRSVASINALAQISSQAFASFTELQNDSLNKQIENIEIQKAEIDTKLSELADSESARIDRQKEKEAELTTARGMRRTRLLEDLRMETEAAQKAEKEREKLEKEKLVKEQEINKKRQEMELNTAKAAVANTAIQIATQSAVAIAALASQSAKQDVTFGIATIGSIAALGVALGVQIKKMKDLQSEFKYEKGGVIDGPSHSNGGVKILGGTAEVEGGELIVNKNIWSRPSFVRAISDMNAATGGKKFYQGGGVLDTTTMNASISSTNTDMIELRNDIIKLSNRPIYTAITDINNAQERISVITDISSI